MKTSISKAAAAMGRVKSAKKASASRENGKRGGRPKECKACTARIEKYLLPGNLCEACLRAGIASDNL